MITKQDVIAFFEEVHGLAPFPWQLQLAEAALADEWPDAVDAPTGLGKTWSIDVAVLAMANAGLRGQRDVFRRVLFVVDRRTVVDEAWEHARTLEAHLKAAEPGSVSARVADGLRALLGGEGHHSPLEVTRMRGGVTWDSRWADRPDQPVIVLSTIDQVGSRLLFRGYGVSDGMRPIHAALVGCHSMLILDEAHLSGPFAALLNRVRSIQQGTLPVAGLRTLSLSATPEGDARLLSFDEVAHLRNEEARRRLQSDKRLAVLRAGPSGRYAVVAAAVRDLRAGGASRILAVCNTVAGARAVHRELSTHKIIAGLLTGRSRPLDRQRVVDEWLPALGPDTDAGAESVVLVATQTVEVGLNLDVDWLVTEECAQNAVVQRLGRVNRFGRRTGAALVVATGAEDPVYGKAAENTTAWLEDLGAPRISSVVRSMNDRSDWLDVSPLALRHAIGRPEPAGEDAGHPPFNRPATPAPMTDRSLFDTWAQTSPVPAVDVPVDPFLHGLGSADATVVVAWRGDLIPGQPLTLPVSAQESIELPLTAFRRWVAGIEGSAVADLDGIGPGETVDGAFREVRRVADDLAWEWVDARRLRPGDTVVVRSGMGGLDRWGWAPESTDEVLDIADLVERGGYQIVRVDERTLRPLVQGVPTLEGWGEIDDMVWKDVAAALRAVQDVADSGSTEEVAERLIGLASAMSSAVGPRSRPEMTQLIERIPGGELTVVGMHRGSGRSELDDRDGRPLIKLSGQAWVDQTDVSGVADDCADSTTLLGRRVGLDQHSRAVGSRAREFADGLGLGSRLADAVERAGLWHDLGKRDARFQAMLWGGVRPHSGSALLAKSGAKPRSRLGQTAARLSGYPPGMRHEALSARLAQVRLGLEGDAVDGIDQGLLVHLVASHHGRARPLLHTADDPQPQRVVWIEDGREVIVTTDIEDDLGLVTVFDQLNGHYGPWGLALLESIVRLADMACSSEGS